jgi:hypothetical protein
MNALLASLGMLADELRGRVHGAALVDASGDGLDFEIRVTPAGPDRCPFIVHAQSENELTVEFGEFSTGHFHGKDLAAVIDSCRSLVDDIIAGDVRETIWSRNGEPCKAVAHVGIGDDALKFETRNGLCLRATKRDREYVGY